MLETNGTYQYGLANTGNSLTSGGSREIDGQVWKAENAHQREQPLLCDKLPTVVVSRVVAENGLYELHLRGEIENRLAVAKHSQYSM